MVVYRFQTHRRVAITELPRREAAKTRSPCVLHHHHRRRRGDFTLILLSSTLPFLLLQQDENKTNLSAINSPNESHEEIFEISMKRAVVLLKRATPR